MTRFLHALALRERSLLPVLQPRLPGPFERPESPMEPGWRAEEPDIARATDFQTPAVSAVSEPAPVVQRRPQPVAPAGVDAPLEPALRDAATAPVDHAMPHVVASAPAPALGPASPLAVELPHRVAEPEARRHAIERVEPAPPADTSARALQPMTLPLASVLHRPPAAQPGALPRWTPRAEPAPSPEHAVEPRRAAVSPTEADAHVQASAFAGRRDDPSPPTPRPWAPLAAQAAAPADRPVARPAQGSLVDAGLPRLLMPALMQQAQAQSPRPAAHDGHDAAAPPAGPTVHVSIGRVEVRAAAPAAATVPATRARAPARSPTLSLNDYLQQRGATTRRGGGTGGAR